MENFKDADGNELYNFEKVIACALLLLFTCFSAYLILGLWPDRIPLPTEKVQAYYQCKLFHVKLVKITDEKADALANLQVLNAAECSDQENNCRPDTIKRMSTSLKKGAAPSKTKTKEERQLDSLQAVAAAKSGIATEIEEAKKALAKSLSVEARAKSGLDSVNKSKETFAQLLNDKYMFDKLIHLNTLQLMLVALAGFLGNMIYIGASFTTFLGSGQFKRSWLLWYIIKPLIAAGLAIAIYFLLCGGFLTLNNSANSININAIMSLALLTGLYTDRATLKLGEVFDVVFKGKKENGADQLVGAPKVSAIMPSEFIRGSENKISVVGEAFQTGKVKLYLDDVELESEIKTSLITANYIPGDDVAGKTKMRLTVKSGKGALIAEKEIILKDPPAI
jgi:hypothetical protein